MAVWKTTFVSEHLNTACSPNWPSVLHSLHGLPVAVLLIPADSSPRTNYVKNAKHIVDYLSHVFFLACTHLHKCQEVKLLVWSSVSQTFSSCWPLSHLLIFCRPPNDVNNEKDNQRVTQNHKSLIHVNICSCFLNGLTWVSVRFVLATTFSYKLWYSRLDFEES